MLKITKGPLVGAFLLLTSCATQEVPYYPDIKGNCITELTISGSLVSKCRSVDNPAIVYVN